MRPRIVLLGGGIMSAAAALEFRRAGYPVTVLERNELASGASGANLGQLSLFDRTEPWHHALACETFSEYAQLGDAIGYQRSGGVVVLQDEAQYQGAVPVCQTLRSLGEPAELLSGKETRRVEPLLEDSVIRGVLYCPNEGKLDPLRTTLYYFRQAQKCGADIRLHTEVTGFQTAGGRISAVQTTSGPISGDIFINAAGAWSGPLAQQLGISLPIGFHRATAFVSQPVPPCIRGPIVGGELFLAHRDMSLHRHIGLGGIQTANGSIIIAQATETSDIESRDVTLPGLCLTARTFLDHFPTLADLQIVRAWASVTPYTTDGLPIFGFSRDWPELFHFTGFKGAFSIAPAAARKLVRTIRDGENWEGRAFSPDRPIHM